MNTELEDVKFEERWVLVTGANGHIGRPLARELARQGYYLVISDKDEVSLAEHQTSLLSDFTTRVLTVGADLESPSDRDRLIRVVQERVSALFGIVNLAAFVGTSELEGWLGPLQNQSIETWNRVLEVNLTAPFHLVKGFEKALKGSGCGAVVNVSSIYGLYGPNPSLYDEGDFRNPAAYAASKGGLIQLTRWLAAYLGPEIRVNAIALGGVMRGQPADFVERYSALNPLRRMATESDAVSAIVFLISRQSSYITGETLSVDGGWGVW